jgi:hypothetical protein
LSDSLTFAAIGGTALKEGITFLYAQAGELIKQLRDRKHAEPAVPSAPTQFVIRLPAGLGGHLLTVAPDPAAIEARQADLLRLRSALANYADGLQPVHPADPVLARTLDELRTMVELIIGQCLTFQGEERTPSGEPVVRSELRLGSVKGTAIGVDVDRMRRGRVDSLTSAEEVGPEGDVTGVRIRTLGHPR